MRLRPRGSLERILDMQCRHFRLDMKAIYLSTKAILAMSIGQLIWLNAVFHVLSRIVFRIVIGVMDSSSLALDSKNNLIRYQGEFASVGSRQV